MATWVCVRTKYVFSSAMKSRISSCGRTLRSAESVQWRKEQYSRINGFIKRIQITGRNRTRCNGEKLMIQYTTLSRLPPLSLALLARHKMVSSKWTKLTTSVKIWLLGYYNNKCRQGIKITTAMTKTAFVKKNKFWLLIYWMFQYQIFCGKTMPGAWYYMERRHSPLVIGKCWETRKCGLGGENAE